MDYLDKLTLEITTDGSIDPEAALGKSAQILVEHFSLVEKACQIAEPAEVKETKKKTEKTLKNGNATMFEGLVTVPVDETAEKTK